MPGAVALVGGDEFRPGCEEMDRAILEASGVGRPRAVVLPTAAALERPERAAANGVEYLTALGAEASAVMVLDSEQADDEALLAPLDAAEVVYLTGGNPQHLLGVLSGSLLLERLRQALERGAVLAGSSAGAMVLGSWMRFRGWVEALGVVSGVAALPHHERSEPQGVSDELSESGPPGVVALGIDGKTCLLGSPDEWRVFGAGQVTAYQRGKWRRFSPGDRVRLERTPGETSGGTV